MTLRQQIEQDLIMAMKAKDAERLSVLRFLLSAVKYKEVDKKSDLVDQEILEVIAKQVKTHKESIESFKKGNRPDLVVKEESELKILQSYLPAQMSEDEVRGRVIESFGQLKGDGKSVDFGMLMKASMAVLKGQVEGAVVKKIAEEVLKEK